MLVLFVTVALGALAASAIALTRSTTLVSRYYERERDYRYAAEAGLAVGRSRVQRDSTFVLPDSGFVTIPRSSVLDANGAPIARAGVTLYIGKSGITTGQYGQFVTVIARADDGSNTRYVRRVELAAENFARFAMFTNTWQNGLCYGTGEFIRGLAWSNQTWASCGSPTYYDTVSAVGAITATGSPAPTYVKGPASVNPSQAPIPMPTVSRLAFMPGYAAGANLAFQPVANTALRLEFVAADLNGNGDSTAANEGFVRAYRTYARPAGDSTNLRPFKLSDWGYQWNSKPAAAGQPPTYGNMAPWADSLCGDFHNGRFYPVVVHKTQWFANQVAGATDAGTVNSAAPNVGSPPTPAEHDRVMQNPTARCYPAGAPQLVAVDRDPTRLSPSGANWTAADAQKGGEDTTFTPNGRWGQWVAYSGTVSPVVASSKRAGQAKYLYPISKQLNPGWKGIIYVNGDVYVSGQLRSRVTLYSSGSVYFLDDLVYVTPPNAPGTDCNAGNANMLGIIAVDSVMIDDNALQRPVRILYTKPVDPTFGTDSVRFMSGTGPHFRLHGVVMALTGTVGVMNYNTGPSIAAGTCNGQPFSGGCIAQVGGVIEQAISATYDAPGHGFAENREVDQCMRVTSPPYFPTTGRYLLNRYYESDPSRFNPVSLFQTLQSN